MRLAYTYYNQIKLVWPVSDASRDLELMGGKYSYGNSGSQKPKELIYTQLLPK